MKDTLGRARIEIAQAVRRGSTMDEIDARYIRSNESFTEEKRAALWLYAFALIGRHEQRRIASEAFELAEVVG